MKGYNMGGTIVTCPYYRRERPKCGENSEGKGFMYCEMARFSFPDSKTRRNLVYKYCCRNGKAEDNTECTVKNILDIYYEEQYKQKLAPRKHRAAEIDVGDAGQARAGKAPRGNIIGR